MIRSVDRDQPMRFQQIGDSLVEAMASKDRPLSQKGGSAHTIFSLTESTLRERCRRIQAGPADTERVVAFAWEQLEKGLTLCESPIECETFAALMNGDYWGFGTVPPLVHDAKNDKEFPKGDLVIVPQFAFARYRVDFALIATRGKHHRCIVAVECDGGEFHRDYAKDMLRDLYLDSWGITTYRLKGRDINFDPVRAVTDPVYHLSNWLKELSEERKTIQAAA